MLTHPTIEKLYNLKLTGMVKALTEQRQMSEIDSLGFEELELPPQELDVQGRFPGGRPQTAKRALLGLTWL